MALKFPTVEYRLELRDWEFFISKDTNELCVVGEVYGDVARIYQNGERIRFNNIVYSQVENKYSIRYTKGDFRPYIFAYEETRKKHG